MSLEKEFVTYEQALALKELGFEEPVFNVYSTDSKTLIIEEGDPEGMTYGAVIENKLGIAAPLWQEAYECLYTKGGVETIGTPVMPLFTEWKSKCLDELLQSAALVKDEN